MVDPRIAARESRSRLPLLAILLVSASAVLLATSSQVTKAGAEEPATMGAFSSPFAEPTINGQRTDYKCIRRNPRPGLEPSGPLYTPFWDCKPAAGSLNTLPGRDSKLLYWNALESTENINAHTFGEFGNVAVNDQSRRMDLNPLNPFSSIWRKPSPVDGGANPPPEGAPDAEFLAVPNEIGRALDPAYNDGSMFCADNAFLIDGRVVVIGGSIYKNDPPTLPDGGTPGPAEVQGARNMRIYNPATNRWTQAPNMNFGRWYPALITLGDRGGHRGDLFAASGVKNLIKFYDEQGLDPAGNPWQPGTGVDLPNSSNNSGENVDEVEIFDNGRWQVEGSKELRDPSDRALPLYPRIHLLPNGHVYYGGGGQVFNPNGSAYNEALWNIAGAYDPQTERWNDMGIPGANPGSPPDPTDGFRGSTFSVMLPLKAGSDGRYSKATFLTAGGIIGTTPGTYLAVKQSREDTIDTGAADAVNPSGVLTSRDVGALNNPRWFSHGTLLPNGEVVATSGAQQDETIMPGSEIPVKQAEIYNPETKQWRVDAEAHRLRTYHNTAALLPDARVLVGGHAPLFGPGMSRSIVPQDPENPHRPYAGGQPYNQPTSQVDGRDPTFEIYTPPYLRWGFPQPAAPQADRCWSDYGGYEKIELPFDSTDLASIVLVRNPSVTHITDADQRNVELKIVARSGNAVWVNRPPNANVAPPGPYMLFANRQTSKGLLPSKSKQVYIGAADCPNPDADGHS
ncbi:MAG TPA: galactose oxidase-like domain-containing protein [Solirubrobacterales bacterium]|jgi:hypothetical protein|nr:galactose oxidase-like domain-containing protein [Solirubrobacterales bacterium]